MKQSFSQQQVASILSALGTDCRGDCNNNDPLVFQTVCHNHDHSGSYKLYYYPDSQRFHCYTHCGDNFDIYELIQRARNCSFYEALLFVQQVLHIDLSTSKESKSESSIQSDLDLISKYIGAKKRADSIETCSFIAPSVIDLYSKVYPLEWLNDHISANAIDRFNIRFDIAENEIIIPHYDINGNLIGIRSRTFNKRKLVDGGKYMPTILEGHDFRHTLRYHLYGLDKVKDKVKKHKKIILFEAEKSALQSYSYYGEDSIAVAVCGSNISIQQRNLLLSLGVRDVTIAFDKEYHEAYTEESDHYADKLLRLAGMFTLYMDTYILWDTDGLIGYKDSPTDHGKEVFERLMGTRFKIGK